MAKIYTDVLVLGDELAGLLTGALLCKRGLLVHHLPNPCGANNPSARPIHSLWPGYRDSLNRKFFDELDLNLDFSRQFESSANFAFIREGKCAVYAFSNHENPSKDIIRSFKNTGVDFANAILACEPVLLENTLALAAMAPVRLRLLNQLRRRLLARRLAYNTLPTAKAKLNMALSCDPDKLLSISHFFEDVVQASSRPSFTQTLLAYKHGLTLPKNESLSTYEALCKLIQSAFKKYGGLIHPKQEIAHVGRDRKKLHEVSTKNGETFVAKAVIDATELSLQQFWPMTNWAARPVRVVPSLQIKAMAESEAISFALPRVGFFNSSKEGCDILCHYQILAMPSKAELSPIPAGAELQERSKKKIIHLKLLALGDGASEHILMEEARRIMARHFSCQQMPADAIEKVATLSPFELPQDGVLTEHSNLFRATYALTPGLGINGEFANAYAIFSALGRVFRYKP